MFAAETELHCVEWVDGKSFDLPLEEVITYVRLIHSTVSTLSHSVLVHCAQVSDTYVCLVETSVLPKLLGIPRLDWM